MLRQALSTNGLQHTSTEALVEWSHKENQCMPGYDLPGQIFGPRQLLHASLKAPTFGNLPSNHCNLKISASTTPMWIMQEVCPQEWGGRIVPGTPIGRLEVQVDEFVRCKVNLNSCTQ
jgi:hypothetical protein